MTMIDVKNLKFGYEGNSDYLFDGVSFRIDTDWKLGLIGRNGRGKTTLMRILRGELPYGGTITGLPKFISFPFEIENEYELGGDIVRMNAPNAQDWEIRREMNYLELDEEILYRPYCLMSGGEKTKIQLISLFLDELAFPLIDEPTNHLDRHGREVTADYLKRKKGFILISHDRVFLDNSTDHTMAINKTDIEISPVTFSTWWEQKEIKEKFESVQNERLKKDIARLNGAKEEARRWSDKSQSKIIGFDPRTTEKQTGRRAYESSKATKMARHMKSIERRYDRDIEEKEGLLKNQEMYQGLKVTGQKHYKDLLVKVADVQMWYDDGTSSSDINEAVSFEINQGDVIALNGTNGSGKSTLLKLIAGIDVPNLKYRGDLYVAPNLKVSYVMQDTSKLKGSLRDYSFEVGVDETRFKSILRKMGLSKENLDQEISSLSEGQKKSVLIAGSLCQEPNLFIWDEPLNYIDIYIRKTIEDMLKEADITMIYVEHDRAFTEATSNKTAEIIRIE